MKIITTPDARLREKSEKVSVIDDETLKIISDMRELSLDWEKEHPYELSAAMAAPQMGVLKRIICAINLWYGAKGFESKN